MLAVSLIFVGITLFLNGLISWRKTDYKFLIILNLFTSFIVLLFNIYLIMEGDPALLAGYFGGLLFGLTNLLIAFDKIFDNQSNAFGWFSLLAFICTIALSIFFFANADIFKGIAWAVWSTVWLFAFIGFACNRGFLKATYLMFILQGAITTGGFGLLLLFDIVKF